MDGADALGRLHALLRDPPATWPGRTEWLRRADLECVHAGASIVVRACNGPNVLAIRMEAAAAHDRSFSLEKQHRLVQLLCAANPSLRTRLPEIVHFEPRGPLILEEYVEARIPMFPSVAALQGPIEVIRELNETPVTDELRALLRCRWEERGLGAYLPKWACRLALAYRRAGPRSAAAAELVRIAWLAGEAWRALGRVRVAYPRRLTFHFDGAHTGNFLCRGDGRMVVLDLDKASLRQDPTFALVHFLASWFTRHGDVDPLAALQLAIGAYRRGGADRGFEAMAVRRLIEREVSEVVWLAWDGLTGPRREFPAFAVRRRREFIQRLLRRI